MYRPIDAHRKNRSVTLTLRSAVISMFGVNDKGRVPLQAFYSKTIRTKKLRPIDGTWCEISEELQAESNKNKYQYQYQSENIASFKNSILTGTQCVIQSSDKKPITVDWQPILGDVAKELSKLVLHAPEEEAAPSPTLSEDILELLHREDLASNITQRQALINARVGQGKYRQSLLELWGGVCAASGCAIPEILRASHLKPWAASTDDERLDHENGLPLIATLDALLDQGLITFAENGDLAVSSKIPVEQAAKLNLPDKLRKTLNGKQRHYLGWHREYIFRP